MTGEEEKYNISKKQFLYFYMLQTIIFFLVAGRFSLPFDFGYHINIYFSIVEFLDQA